MASGYDRFSGRDFIQSIQEVSGHTNDRRKEGRKIDYLFIITRNRIHQMLQSILFVFFVCSLWGGMRRNKQINKQCSIMNSTVLTVMVT